MELIKKSVNDNYFCSSRSTEPLPAPAGNVIHQELEPYQHGEHMSSTIMGELSQHYLWYKYHHFLVPPRSSCSSICPTSSAIVLWENAELNSSARSSFLQQVQDTGQLAQPISPSS